VARSVSSHQDGNLKGCDSRVRRSGDAYLGLVLGKELDAVGLWLWVLLGWESAPDDLVLVVGLSDLEANEGD